MTGAQVAALLGIENEGQLLEMLKGITSPELAALAEDLPYASTSSILSLITNPDELVAHFSLSLDDLKKTENIKILLAGTTMLGQELDKRIPPRLKREASTEATSGPREI